MNKIRERWSAGSSALVGWLQIPSALHTEALAHCGYDGLVIDMQHSPVDFSMAVAMMTAIENAGIEPIVRVQRSEPAEIMKLMDAGAYGVIAPMIETESQARELASAIHYAPRGTRSFGPRRPVLRYGDQYWSMASETFFAFAMVETRLGLENLDAILNVDGLDGVFVGPSDLALSLGYAPKPESQEPEVVEAISRIRSRAHAAGKRVGIYCNGSEFARAKIAEGFDFVSVGPDLSLLTAGARRIIAETRGALAN
jgi:4-hydroxy-2-oxoheptanedioate aldolase